MAHSIRSGPAAARAVRQTAAWSAGLRFLPRKLKAEVWGAEPRKHALRVTSKEGTTDFADFTDEGDAAQGSRWPGKVAWSGQRHAWPPCSPGLSYPCQPRHPRSDPSPRGKRRLVAVAPPRNPKLSGTRRPSPSRPAMASGLETSRLHTSHAFETNTPWDETSQPPSRPAMTSGVETSQPAHLPRPRNARHQFGTSSCAPSPTHLQNPERVSDSSRG